MVSPRLSWKSFRKTTSIVFPSRSRLFAAALSRLCTAALAADCVLARVGLFDSEERSPVKVTWIVTLFFARRERSERAATKASRDFRSADVKPKVSRASISSPRELKIWVPRAW
ncbi:uncharacterized protein C8R40DRAFT_1121414 [Lentinula edodes]|uniref:uncharacterized protein n=1 Tax=Lentinula edodes TaxID=5353 RepID=UPI001E8D11B4|nr:uncharacterized protein C8R40DRAFT_1121414 [Lentinula edodes]KAH7871641.1 hypothetical protein C8R40DRAFT_1121414 [Lentinula edodes]